MVLLLLMTVLLRKAQAYEQLKIRLVGLASGLVDPCGGPVNMVSLCKRGKGARIKNWAIALARGSVKKK